MTCTNPRLLSVLGTLLSLVCWGLVLQTLDQRHVETPSGGWMSEVLVLNALTFAVVGVVGLLLSLVAFVMATRSTGLSQTLGVLAISTTALPLVFVLNVQVALAGSFG